MHAVCGDFLRTGSDGARRPGDYHGRDKFVSDSAIYFAVHAARSMKKGGVAPAFFSFRASLLCSRLEFLFQLFPEYFRWFAASGAEFITSEHVFSGAYSDARSFWHLLMTEIAFMNSHGFGDKNYPAMPTFNSTRSRR